MARFAGSTPARLRHLSPKYAIPIFSTGIDFPQARNGRLMSSVIFCDDYTPIGEARAWLNDRINRGERCPCCNQFAKIYKRSLPNATARVMIALYQRDQGREFVFLPEILDTMTGTPHQGGYGTLGQFWGLLEPKPGERNDGSTRVGWWRLTDLGRAFVRGEATVPKYARIYAGECLDLCGPQYTIEDALGNSFNFRELIAA